MNTLPLKKVALLWSGGIDSTAVFANLLANGYSVLAAHSDLYESRAPRYAAREAAARSHLIDPMARLNKAMGGGGFEIVKLPAQFLWEFAIKGTGEIPQRNKRMLDLLLAQEVMPRGWMNVAMGEYVGVDTWVVRDHVPPTDCDHRALSAYLLSEYGMRYRFISLQDFGESRYKSDRLRLGTELLGVDAMALTTNCMSDSIKDCGNCYKCIERHAAFCHLEVDDPTEYEQDPMGSPRFSYYMRQMAGEDVTMPFLEA